VSICEVRKGEVEHIPEKLRGVDTRGWTPTAQSEQERRLPHVVSQAEVGSLHEEDRM
jgi:hypothetical protein